MQVGSGPVLPVVMRRAADEHNASAPFIDHRPGVAAGRHEGPRAFSSSPVLLAYSGQPLTRNRNTEPLADAEVDTGLKPTGELCSMI